MKHYMIVSTTRDPEICLKVPKKMLKDLVVRAEENGHRIEVEIAMRLARSLEHDLDMIDADDQLACAAFEKIQDTLNNPE